MISEFLVGNEAPLCPAPAQGTRRAGTRTLSAGSGWPQPEHMAVRLLLRRIAAVAVLAGSFAPSVAAAEAPPLTWQRQKCAANVPGNDADIVTRWGATIDPTKAPPLPEYPRPQLVRSDTSWLNLNGLWEWEPAAGVNGTAATPPPFGRTLNRSILVPFPAESCLSGVRKYSHHRKPPRGLTATDASTTAVICYRSVRTMRTSGTDSLSLVASLGVATLG